MKKLNLFITILFVVAFVSNTNGQAKLTRYFKSAKDPVYLTDPAAVKKYVELKTTYTIDPLIPEKKDETRNIFNLSNRAQEKLIEVLSKEFVGKPSELMKALATPIKEEEKKSESFLNDKSDFVIVINMSLEDYMNKLFQANRISELSFSFLLKSDECNFNGFNNIQTRYDMIDFGKLSVSATKGFTANAGVNVNIGSGSATYDAGSNQTGSNSSSTTPTLGVGYNQSTTTSEELILSKKILSQYGTVDEKYGTLFIQGTPTNNLGGPVRIELRMKPKGIGVRNLFEMKDLFTDKNVANPGTAVTYKIISTLFPSIDNDIKVDVKCDFIYRKVIGNEKTVIEGDDVIQQVHGSILINDLVVLKADDLNNKVYMVQYTDPNNKSNKQSLSLSGLPIYFSTMDRGALFLTWLNQSQSVFIGKDTLKLNNATNLVTSHIKDLSLERTK